MVTVLDDDDTTPTANDHVLREIRAGVRRDPVGIIEWAGASASGTRRRHNEDAWGSDGEVFAIADGMGGRRGGIVASQTAVDSYLGAREPPYGVDPWRGRVAQVNESVRAAGRDVGIERLGTTLLVAHVDGDAVTLVHVGDCRAYRYGAERFDVLTHDHDVHTELLDAGLDIGTYRARGVAMHALTSFLGLETDLIRVDVLATVMRPGERLLLCTDGVHRQVTNYEMHVRLSQDSCQAAADGLIAAADEAGGRDNATAIVVEFGRQRGPES